MGGAIAGCRPLKDRSVFSVIILVLIFSNLPDIDLLFGFTAGSPNRYHHMWTHSILFCVAAGLLSGFILTRFSVLNGLTTGLMLSAVLLSHLALDMFTRDSSFPYGMQLFWPFSGRYYIGKWTPLPDVYKTSVNASFFRAVFSMHNLKTAGIEALVFTPFLVLALIRPKKRKRIET